MRVLLISPEFPDTFWSFKHAVSFIRRAASFPPLGLLTVAAMLPEAWAKRLVDLNVVPLADADLAWADIAFVGAMTAQRASARAVIARCREAGLKVVAGGPLYTAEPDAHPEVDHLVLGEAEITLPRFLRDLACGAPRRLYPADAFADVTATPVPLWGLADLRAYASVSVQFSRGCPHDCDFCSVTAMLGHRPRIKRSAQVIAELDRLHALGWRGPVFFVDDNLIGHKRALREELLPVLLDWQRRRGRGIPFTAQVAMNLADDDDLMRGMASAGFDAVFIGIETSETAALVECNKKQNLGRDLIGDVKRIQRAGMEIFAGFIVGFDHDTPETFVRHVAFIQESGIAAAMVGLLQAPPGTRLHARMRAEGRLLGAISGDNADGSTNVRPRMSLDALLAGYRSLLLHLYAPRPYYQRVRTFLREFRAPEVRVRMDCQRLLAFARSAGRLGIVGAERLHFWKLMAWTLVRRPRLFSRAVTLSIYGYHFRRVSERQGSPAWTRSASVLPAVP
jgi:radical SAM superfamily enzyme YgiQ (UPF0313 family)